MFNFWVLFKQCVFSTFIIGKVMLRGLDLLGALCCGFAIVGMYCMYCMYCIFYTGLFFVLFLLLMLRYLVIE